MQFKEVFLTPRFLGIAMEYAGGGDMFEFFVRNKVRRADDLMQEKPGMAHIVGAQQSCMPNSLHECLLTAYFTVTDHAAYDCCYPPAPLLPSTQQVATA